jgi:hypothetical protein
MGRSVPGIGGSIAVEELQQQQKMMRTENMPQELAQLAKVEVACKMESEEDS